MVICATAMDLPGIRFRDHVTMFLATGACMAGAALLLGPTLGSFFAGLLVATLLLPFAGLGFKSLGQDLLALGSVSDAIALVWLVLALGGESIALLDWVKAYVLLLGIALFQAGLVGSLRRLRISAPSAGGLSIVIMLLWLCAPVWLLHHLQSPALLPWMQRVINVHPLFAINSAVPLGIWTESPVAYRILNLNQDVYYTMPGFWLAALLHGVVGAVLMWINDRPATKLYK